jgi:hypothetical protein
VVPQTVAGRACSGVTSTTSNWPSAKIMYRATDVCENVPKTSPRSDHNGWKSTRIFTAFSDGQVQKASLVRNTATCDNQQPPFALCAITSFQIQNLSDRDSHRLHPDAPVTQLCTMRVARISVKLEAVLLG